MKDQIQFIGYEFLVLLTFCLALGCRTSKSTLEEKPSLQQLITQQLFQDHFVGFSLFDPSTKSSIFRFQDDKYYTPASNTKIFTLYTGLNVLADQMNTFKYVEQVDSIFIWGMGNPSFLHPTLPNAAHELEFLQSFDQKVMVLSNHHYEDKKYGSGWSWDDGLYAYQLEKSYLPIFGNLVIANGLPNTRTISLEPRYFNNFLYINIDTSREYGYVKRDPLENKFIYNYQIFDTIHNERLIPIQFSNELLLDLLEDTLDRSVYIRDIPIDKFHQEAQALVSQTPIDSVYKLLMQKSDNFIAEQILLNCSMELFDTMSTEKIIRYAKDSIFTTFPDSLIWVDGSGLSRYNMFTPRTIIYLLDKVLSLKSMDWIKEIFPAGGVSGTIKSYYQSDNDEPYVWAKTGTLRHNHCLSGYVQCASGKVLIFSFMHNHFTTPSAAVKKEMDQVLQFIQQNY